MRGRGWPLFEMPCPSDTILRATSGYGKQCDLGHDLTCDIAESPHVCLGAGVEYPTFNPGKNVTLEVGDTGASGDWSTSLFEPDLEPCAPDAVLHSIRKMLKPEGLVLPESAAPRTPTPAGSYL